MLNRIAFALAATLSTAVYAAPTQQSEKLVEIAEFGQRQPVGITVSQENRMFLTFPRQTGATEFKYALAEIVDGKEVPPMRAGTPIRQAHRKTIS